MKLRWIKNSACEPDAMLTFAMTGFIVVSLSVLLSMFDTIHFRNLSLDIVAPSETLLLGYLASTFGSYVVRRNKKDQLCSDESIEQMKSGILPADDDKPSGE